MKTKAITIREPGKVKTASFFSPVSGCGLPQLYAVVEAGFVQVDVGQEQVTCLSLLAEMSQQFTSPPGVKNQTSKLAQKAVIMRATCQSGLCCISLLMISEPAALDTSLLQVTKSLAR